MYENCLRKGLGPVGYVYCVSARVIIGVGGRFFWMCQSVSLQRYLPGILLLLCICNLYCANDGRSLRWQELLFILGHRYIHATLRPAVVSEIVVFCLL